MQKELNKNLPDTNAGKYIKIGLSVLILVFGIVGTWSALAPMDSGVPLPGEVVVEANNKKIQHLEGGIVEKIYVDDGDKVKKGDVLIKFSETQAKASLLSLQANYYESLALESRLIAENTNQNEITFSKELDALSLEKKAHLINSQIEIFNNEKSSFEKQKIISAQKTKSLSTHIENVKDTISSLKILLKSYKDEQKEQQDLYDERLIDKVKLREVSRKIESIKSDILKNETDITRASIQISEEKTKLMLQQEDFYRNVQAQLRDTQTAIEDMKARILAVKDKLTRTSIKAPVDGTVHELQVHTVGAVVSPAKPIMEIIPEDSKLIIRAKLSPEHIDYAKVGLKANMTFPAFQLKGSFIKNIEGEVIFVAADSTTDQKGNAYYIVKLIVDEEGKKTLKDEDLHLLTGMPASVVIKLGKQTPLEYMLKPMTMMLDRAFLEQ